MLESSINFIIECEKLKGVLRQSSPIGENRKENSAEHSWSAVLSAIVFLPSLAPEIDALKVIKMLSIHDIIEIDAGDTFCYADQTGKFERENLAAKRLFNLLDKKQADEFFELWMEFEKSETNESKFANAIDRLLPLIQNFHNGGQSWKEHGITFEQVYNRNQKICEGSEPLWKYAEELIDLSHRKGYLPKISEPSN